MRIKKWILFLAFIFLIQLGFGLTVSVSAIEVEDSSEVKRVLETFLEHIKNRDFDSAMQLVSPNYSDKDRKGNEIDYARFRSIRESSLRRVDGKYVNQSISNFKITQLEFQDNKATVEYEFDFKSLNLYTLEDEITKEKRHAILVKENGIWKIVQWRRIDNQAQNFI